MTRIKLLLGTSLLFGCLNSSAQIKGIPTALVPLDQRSFEQAKPWVFWYFMHASYSKEGIAADLKAMAENKIAGAYLAPIKGKTNPPLFNPPTESLTPEWWDMFGYIVAEAKKYGLKIALLPNDGFATAGGPWISPEKSMQKLVYADTVVNSKGGRSPGIQLPQPQTQQGYYEDIALFAMPLTHSPRKSFTELVQVTNSYGEDLKRLAERGNKQNFAAAAPGWIQYAFERPFPCNSLKIEWTASNYQANRLQVWASDDGLNFRKITQLESPRMGWLDWDNGVTHLIPYTKAKYFRFVYDPTGSEPGAEDLDSGKWKPSLKLNGISLFEEAQVHQIEGKTGEIWRVGKKSDPSAVVPKAIIGQQQLIRLPKPDQAGRVDLTLPAGRWKILRVGHTSTGHKNETAGAGKGLECDKLDAATVAFQFDQWFGAAKKHVDPHLSKEVLTVFHIDSWECGSQNWTRSFPDEFLKRRGYDLTNYLPVLAGCFVNSVEDSEAFLQDYRQTISELLQENGYATLRRKADEYGVEFTAEATAPVMVGDGLAHFASTDRPMGEFWFRSPSHDKPADILDAISGSHIYGKRVTMSEAFTQIRAQWDEHPRLLKSLQDRNYALGINNLVYHVYVHNPWMDRKPGMTMDGIGTYFQRDQTWWKPGKEWVNYAIRSQQLLQYGVPVRDVAVFIGEEIPRRSVLPSALIDFLPGIIGEARVHRTDSLLANVGLPLQKVAGVTTGANMYRPEDWVDPLRGYAYDSFNPDALWNQTSVQDGKVIFANHIAYALLVMPGETALNPNGSQYSLRTLERIRSLVNQGATVLFQDIPQTWRGKLTDDKVQQYRILLDELFTGLEPFTNTTLQTKQIGKGRVLVGNYKSKDFSPLNIAPDVLINEGHNPHISWNHRRFDGGDLLFVANQDSLAQKATLSLRTKEKYAYRYDPVSDKLAVLPFKVINDRTVIELSFDAYQSSFVLTSDKKIDIPTYQYSGKTALTGPWSFTADGLSGKQAIKQQEPQFWTASADDDIKYHAGAGSYQTTIHIQKIAEKQRAHLQFSAIESMAEIFVNGQYAGVVWTKPYQIDVTDFIRQGDNKVQVKVYNIWGNRFLYEKENTTVEKKIQTTASDKFLKGLLPSGLQGKVDLLWLDAK
ncbi:MULTISPECIES: glycosyl hydrolase [unclassified Sphingobacterium]|uniref:glycosyl hydrolase n=1 Tax=unclassified Sphingobacterium TaxID=2609468 RepID=UPI0025E82C66|nr:MULTISPECIES: glycosyl hydrolase [unclassified Sphingobacterium]